MSNQKQLPVPGDLSPSSLRINYFLLVFLISIFFLGRILWPFWSILVLSFLLTSIFQPIYNFFVRKMPPVVASILTCHLIFLIVFVPLFFFVAALSTEALSLYHWGRDAQVGLLFQNFLQNNKLTIHLTAYIHDAGIDFEPAQLTGALSYLAKTGGLFLYNQASTWAANFLQFLVLFCMMILVIFFLLIDMDKLIKFIIRLSPLPDDEDRLLLKKFEQIANAILKGNGICGLMQGILGGSLFAILGFQSPLLWGGIMAILAFLPIFGIGLVMVPAAVVLLISDRMAAGIFLFIFYISLSFSVEYILKPKLVGDEVSMHTLLVFLSIIGGLSVYGVLGIIYGPLIITGFLTLTDIYLKKYDVYIQKM